MTTILTGRLPKPLSQQKFLKFPKNLQYLQFLKFKNLKFLLLLVTLVVVAVVAVVAVKVAAVAVVLAVAKNKKSKNNLSRLWKFKSLHLKSQSMMLKHQSHWLMWRVQRPKRKPKPVLSATVLELLQGAGLQTTLRSLRSS